MDGHDHGQDHGHDDGDGREIDWAAFELERSAYVAERDIATLVAGGARIAESLGVPFSPASFVLGALFRELGDVEAPDFAARVAAVRRLARHAGTVAY